MDEPVTPQEAAATLPPLTDDQCEKVAALLLMSLNRPKNETA